MSTRQLVELLVWLLVLLIVVWVAHLVIGMLGLPHPIGLIAVVIVGLVALLAVLKKFGAL